VIKKKKSRYKTKKEDQITRKCEIYVILDGELMAHRRQLHQQQRTQKYPPSIVFRKVYMRVIYDKNNPLFLWSNKFYKNIENISDPWGYFFTNLIQTGNCIFFLYGFFFFAA
jgi:hypothetical protein